MTSEAPRVEPQLHAEDEKRRMNLSAERLQTVVSPSPLALHISARLGELKLTRTQFCRDANFDRGACR